jgi:hypothetical protein
MEEESQPSGPQPPAPGIEHATLSWRIWRAQETPVRTMLVTMLIVAIVVVALVYYGLIMAVAAVLILFLALNSYYLPTTYVLDQQGITVNKAMFRYTRRWNEFRSFVRTSGGVVVSTFSNWTYLDNFRGIHLLLPLDPKPVLDYLKQRLPEKTRTAKRSKG